MISHEETAALVARAQRGEPEAFATLASAFLRAAYAVALAIVGRPADAEDIAQDAFVVALERIGSCRERERFAGWLLQIVRNRSLNWLDRRRVRDATPEAGAQVIAIAALRPEKIGLAERLTEALAELTATEREVVLLHDLEEWTHPEIGAAIGISEGMSRQHLWKARAVLRSLLAEDSFSKVDHERK